MILSDFLKKNAGRRANNDCDLTPRYVASNDDLDGVFETMWFRVAGEQIPDNINYYVLPEEKFVSMNACYGRATKLYLTNDNGCAYRCGDIGFFMRWRDPKNPRSRQNYKVYAVENPISMVLEVLGHEGLGHVRYLRAKPDAPTEDNILSETAAYIGAQQGKKAIYKTPPGVYVDNYFVKSVGAVNLYPGTDFHKRANGYAKRLIERFGADGAWNKILAVENEEKLKEVCVETI